MNTTQLEERFEKIGIVPVVVLDDAKDALPLAKALCNGGLPCAEITFRTAAAADSIRAVSYTHLAQQESTPGTVFPQHPAFPSTLPSSWPREFLLYHYLVRRSVILSATSSTDT